MKNKMKLEALEIKGFQTSVIKGGMKQIQGTNQSLMDCPTEVFGGCPETVPVLN